MKLALLAATGLLLLSSALQAQTTINSENFTTGPGSFTGTGVQAVTPSGEHYLELYNGTSASIALNTAGYTGLTATFNLYGIESVDGNGPDGGGADPFLIYINGSATPTYNLNIANYTGGSDTQDFNGILSQSGPGNSYAPKTGALANDDLGYGAGPFGGSTYLVSFALPNSPVTSITFVGNTNEAPSNANGTTGGNEAYGIDNFSLTGTAVSNTISAAPEPGIWLMMTVGFGLVGGMLRSRRKKAQHFDGQLSLGAA